MRTPDTVRGQMAVFVQPQEWDEEAKGSPKPITELRVTAVSKGREREAMLASPGTNISERP